MNNSLSAHIAILENLFELRTAPRIQEYLTPSMEIDAVRSGRKAMAVYSTRTENIRDEELTYVEMVQRCEEAGLLMLHDPDEEAGSITLLIVRPEQTWRAQAYSAMWRTIVRERATWSEEAEALACFLLGYTRDETQEWLLFQRWARASWRGETVYLLVPNAQRVAVEECGNACLPATYVNKTSIRSTVFWYRGRAVIKRRASYLIPAGYSLLRTALHNEVFKAWFRPQESDGTSVLFVSQLDDDALTLFNAALCSKLELYSDEQWVGPDLDLSKYPKLPEMSRNVSAVRTGAAT